MPESSRKFLFGLALVLGGGALIGWLYDHVEIGLLVAALLALAWQVRNLLAFDRALRTSNFDEFRYGEGIWEQLFSRFSFQYQRAERRKVRYRNLLKEVRKSTDAMPDGAVILDENNEILMCNRAAKALAGLKRKKDRGQRVDNILRAPALTRLLERDDATETVEIASPVRDDAWLNCRVVPYGADQKLLFLRDVTDRIRLNKMRRDFVANASHELRSPLTVISGYLESLAEDEDVPEHWSAPVQQMRSQARRMNHIVAELLELSRLESSGRAGSDETVDVGGLLVLTRKSYAGQKDVPKVELDTASTALLKGNANEIESLLVNLVSNAVRHTPADGTVSLTWESGPDGAELAVRDTGEGIAAEHLPRLTERFFRIDRGRSRDDGGVGLGLAIVKYILNRHDASLDIESEPGEGSHFRCRFPASRLQVSESVSLV